MHQIIDENEDPYLLLGHLFCNYKPVRDPKDKWYVSYEMYKEDIFPPYLQGGAYLMARQAALSIWNNAMKIPMMPMEDTFVTGIVAKLAGLEPKGSSTFKNLWGRVSRSYFRPRCNNRLMNVKI